jgi:hypothetical protein
VVRTPTRDRLGTNSAHVQAIPAVSRHREERGTEESNLALRFWGETAVFRGDAGSINPILVSHLVRECLADQWTGARRP